MKSKKFVFMLISIFMVFTLIGCAGQQANEGGSWGDDFPGPEWAESPQDQADEEGVIFKAANAKSKQLNIALQRANLRATNQIAQQLGSAIKGWQEDYQQEMGQAAESEVLSSFESLSERVVDEELQGVKEVERAVKEEDGVYSAWVLMRLNLEDLNNQFSEMERINTEYSRDQAREQLDKNLEDKEE